MAPFLLTNLLVGQLAKSPSGRVVTVSSESYRSGGRPRLDDIELTHSYSLRRSYGLSKLYVYWIMRQFVPELERRAITNVTVNTVEPGSTRTSLGRVSMHNHLMRVVTLLWTPMMWSIGKAAATSIYLATSSEVEGVTGRFYGNLKEKEINPRWISVTGQQQIWVDIVVSTRARFASSGSERTGG